MIKISGTSDCQGNFTDLLNLNRDALLVPALTSGYVQISSSSRFTELLLYDQSGQLLIVKNRLTGLDSVDLSAYSAGLYFVRLAGPGYSKTFKIIKKRVIIFEPCLPFLCAP
jgi:hypothetical protein